MTTPQPTALISRRTTLAGLGAGGLGLALTAATARQAAAQDATANDLADHPNVGVWMVESPSGRALAVYSPDGSVITALAASQAGPAGVVYASTQIGTWEATSERGTHLTVVQLLSDGAGAYAGSVTVDALQEVSEDGQTFTSGAGTTITIRDAADAVLQVLEDLPPAVGTRMGVGAPGFPKGVPASATPAT